MRSACLQRGVDFEPAQPLAPLQTSAPLPVWYSPNRTKASSIEVQTSRKQRNKPLDVYLSCDLRTCITRYEAGLALVFSVQCDRNLSGFVGGKRRVERDRNCHRVVDIA